MIWLMWAAHALADFPLKDKFLTEAKNHRLSPYKAWMPWRAALGTHALIHSGAVLWITGSLTAAIAELFVHAATDYAKCEGWFGMKTDQAIHFGCKVVWAVLAVVLRG